MNATIKARLRGDDRVGHFTEEAAQGLIGQRVTLLAPDGNWAEPRGKGTVIGAQCDATDALIAVEVTAVGVDGHGLPTSDDYRLAAFGLVHKRARSDGARTVLFEVDLLTLYPLVVVPADRGEAAVL